LEYFDRLYHAMGETEPELFDLRLGYLLAQLEHGDRVIDVGCGEGWFCAALAERGLAVAGVDVSRVAIDRARARFPALRFEVSGETSLPFADASFGVAWLGETLEHVRDGLGLLSEVGRVIGAGGRLVATTPDHPWWRRLRLGLSRSAFERHFEPRADHLRFFTRRSLEALLDAAGFEVVDARSRRGVLLVRARAR